MKRLAIFWCVAAILGGCSWFNGATMRSQSPEESAPEPKKPTVHLVGEFAVPTGVQPAKVEAIGLVTGLHSTGSDPVPSPQRAALLEEMQLHNVANPNALLSSGNVSLVLIQGFLRPGIQKGEHFDINVRVPSQSDTASLRGGYLLETRLTETQVGELDNQIHRGSLLALAKGSVLVDPSADPKKNRIACCRGRVLGGGVMLKSRPMGLVILQEYKGVERSSRISAAINKRLHTFENGIQTGVAKAKTDEFIELKIHPRYKDNITRYVEVLRAVPIMESDSDRMNRVTSLQAQLLDPETAAEAAIQLEAIGTEGVPALLKGIQSKDTECKFYAAEALAYLDHRDAAKPLAEIARTQPAFRVFALTALSVMQDYAAYEELRAMLAMPSAETRYGAFRALWTMNSKDSMVKGETIGDQFHYHVLDVAGPPMIHLTYNRLPEVVLFGRGQKLLTPLSLSAGTAIMINSSGGDEIAVSKYSVAEGDQRRVVSTQVDDVIRAIVELGGAYPDVVQALTEAKNAGSLESRFEVDALPEAGRTYDRDESDVAAAEAKQDTDADKAKSARPVSKKMSPDLFSKKSDLGGPEPAKPKQDKSNDDEPDEKPVPKKGFFKRLFGG